MTRVGIVGYGMAGRQIHTPALREAGLEVVAIVTGNPERAEQARSDHPGAKVYADLDALLAAGGLDVIVIASASGAHAEQAHRVIQAGLALVVDKPLGVSADEALDIVDHAARERVPLSVFNNRRYDVEHATVADVVGRGLVGEPFRFEHRWERWRLVPKDRWRENAPAESGGGIMLDLQTHVIDAAVHLFGEIESVFATVDSRTTAAEDDAFLVCRHVAGVVSHLATSSVVAAPGPRIRLLGTQAAYLLSTLAPEESTFAELADEPGSTGWIYRGPDRERVASVVSSQADYYRAVAAALGSEDPQTAMPVDPRDAVHVLAVIDAARISARDHRVVDVITPGQRP